MRKTSPAIAAQLAAITEASRKLRATYSTKTKRGLPIAARLSELKKELRAAKRLTASLRLKVEAALADAEQYAAERTQAMRNRQRVRFEQQQAARLAQAKKQLSEGTAVIIYAKQPKGGEAPQVAVRLATKNPNIYPTPQGNGSAAPTNQYKYWQLGKDAATTGWRSFLETGFFRFLPVSNFRDIKSDDTAIFNTQAALSHQQADADAASLARELGAAERFANILLANGREEEAIKTLTAFCEELVANYIKKQPKPKEVPQC